MEHRLACLVSKSQSLIHTVTGIARPLSRLRLEVVPTSHDIGTMRQKEAAIVLFHVADEDNVPHMAQSVKQLARSDARRATLVLSDDYRNRDAITFYRAGATDYFQALLELYKIENYLNLVSLQPASRAAKGDSPKGASCDAFSFVLSQEMTEMMDQVRRVAPLDTTLLLTGETGTGKTQLARVIHELSPRRDEPFLVVDCGALSAELIESEIFGHLKGAFTGADRDREGKLAAAGRGTLLLDEINALPPHLQCKLLRAVDERAYEPVGSNETRPINARIIAAANVQLDQAVEAGQFRRDLYYRLNVVGFYLPPLRERPSLIVTLANKVLGELATHNDIDIQGFSADAFHALTEYDWPGNIRELRNAIERAVLLATGSEIQKTDLPDFPRSVAAIPGAARVVQRRRAKAVQASAVAS